MTERAKAPPYSPDAARSVLARLAAGESLAAICAGPDMPAEADVLDWAAADRHGFAARYRRAREAAAHRMAEELVAIADNQDGDLNRDKLRVDCRKWVLARLLPETFGDKPATKEKPEKNQTLCMVRWMKDGEEEPDAGEAKQP